MPVDAALFLVKYFLFLLAVCDGMPNMIAQQTDSKKNRFEVLEHFILFNTKLNCMALTIII